MKGMKRPNQNLGGTRNADYYVKKIKKSDARGCPKIQSFFKKKDSNDAEKEPVDDASRVSKNDAEKETVDDASRVSKNDAEKETVDDASRVSKNDAEKKSIDDVSRAEKNSCDKSFGSTQEDPKIRSKNDLNKDYEASLYVNEGAHCSVQLNSPIIPVGIESHANPSTSCASISNEEDSESSVGEIFTAEKIPINIDRYEKLYNWMYYSISAKGFLCKMCSVIYQSGPWVNQAARFGDHPTRAISKHQNSTRHNQAVASNKHVSKKSLQEKFTEGLETVSQKNKESNRKLLSKYIRIIYFMVKNNWAVSEKFSSLVKFIGEDLGDSDIQTYLSTCGKNATYLSNVSVDSIMGAISLYLEEKTVTALKLVDSFALLADESTDESQREQLGLIVRYKIKGVPGFKEEYLGLINLACTNAESITNAIEKFMIVKGIDITNCLFLALDGANVMSGDISGVQRRIRHLSPHSIYVNCRNHRLALIFVHLLKKYGILQDVDSLLVSLWKLFHYSPTKQQVFKDIQANVYCVSILKTLKVSVTRWLSHGLACERVISRFQQLVETLDALFLNRREPELKGLREQLLNADVLLCMLFLSDFLKIINKLSLWLQNSSILFSSVKEKVSITCKEVDDLSENLVQNGENFKKAEELLTFAEECTESSMKRRSKKNLSSFDAIQDFTENFVKNFIADFKREISFAFGIKNEALNAFDMFRTLDVGLKMPSNQDQSCLSVLFSFYGQEQTHEFQGAVKVSPPIIDAAAAEIERDGFEKEISVAKVTYDLDKGSKARSLLIKDKKEEAKKCLEEKASPLDICDLIERDSHNCNLFPNLLKLLRLSVIIPSSTAPVERLFSRMNLICSELRTRMKQETLDRHLRIVLNGPEKLTDAECETIIDNFKSTGNRRILL